MTKDDEEFALEVAKGRIPDRMFVDELYKEFIGKTQIEKFKEETYVLQMIMKGENKQSIIKALRAKHPDGEFSGTDLEKFMIRNDEIVATLRDEHKMLARRHLDSRDKVANSMASLALYTRQLIPELKAQGDNSNLIAAIRALKDTYESYAKIEGLTKAETQTNIVNMVASNAEREEIKKRIHQANFVDADKKPE